MFVVAIEVNALMFSTDFFKNFHSPFFYDIFFQEIKIKKGTKTKEWDIPIFLKNVSSSIFHKKRQKTTRF